MTASRGGHLRRPAIFIAPSGWGGAKRPVPFAITIGAIVENVVGIVERVGGRCVLGVRSSTIHRAITLLGLATQVRTVALWTIGVCGRGQPQA